MYKRLRNIFFVSVVIILAVAFLRLRGQVNPAASLAAAQETAVVDKGEIILTTSASGPISANQKSSLSFQMAGRVALINVSEGDHIRQGQTIAMLDTQDLQDAVNFAQSNLALQQIALRTLTDKPRAADVNVATANLALAQAQLAAAQNTGADQLVVQADKNSVELSKNQLWQSQLQRDATAKQKNDILNATGPGMTNDTKQAQIKQLPSDRALDSQIHAADSNVAISQSQLADDASRSGDVGSIAQAQAAVKSAQVALDKLNTGGTAAQIAVAKSQVDTAQKALDVAKHNLSMATLTAPFGGAIAHLNLDLGESTPVGKPAVVLIDDSSFYVDVPVDEVDEQKVAQGQDATLALDALPGLTVHGTVLRIARTATATGNVITYTARIQIDPKDSQPLRDNMSATVTIILSKVSDVVRLPNRFVKVDSRTGNASVLVQQPDGSTQTINVKLGLRNDTYSQIVSGVKEGDVVVMAPRVAREGNAASFSE